MRSAWAQRKLAEQTRKLVTPPTDRRIGYTVQIPGRKLTIYFRDDAVIRRWAIDNAHFVIKVSHGDRVVYRREGEDQ